jgi:cobyrinic acid a,c-diamide synthase
VVTPLPRLVVAAPSSGSGKTTVAVGLMAALRARGLEVSGHKIGPDYIDPGYHSVATGRPGRNLDAVLCGEQLMAPLLLHGAAGADVAVVEGVMGLFDGRAGTPYGSTAHVAALLGAPVVLVVDARAMSGSVAALVHGFSTYDETVRVAGVILNRVGSDTHEAMLRAALEPLRVPVLGVLRRDDGVVTPARHLGLVPAAERAVEARKAVDRLAAVVARQVDLDAVLALAQSVAPLHDEPWSPSLASVGVGVDSRVGVVTGPAFGFVYPENVELLRAAGAQVVDVHQDDETLPDGLITLYVPGGFPETYAADLSTNARLRMAVADFAERGGAVVAECGGLLWLAEELDGLPMCGVLPAAARMTDRVTLGYREARLASWSLLGAQGDVVRAHEFHYSVLEPGAGAAPAWQLDGRVEGFASDRLHASYLHTHWAGAPALAAYTARGHGPRKAAA